MDLKVAISLAVITGALWLLGWLIIADLREGEKRKEALKKDCESIDPEVVLAYARRLRAAGKMRRALEHYQIAAHLGSTKACHELADNWEVHKADAFKWKLLAAELNDVKAMAWLVDAYAEGNGVLKSIAKSTQWLIRAAEAGHKDSMPRLGNAYAKGYGVPVNPIEGLAWFYVAEFKGSEIAKSVMQEGEKDLSPTVIHLAQERAQAILDLLNAGKSTVDSVDHGAGNLPQQNRPATAKPNRKPNSSGSGAIVSSEGHVVTAAHVLKGASYIEVMTPAGARPASVLSIDTNNDVALLKVDGPFEASLPIGRASEVRLGQTVSTIGFPNIGIQGQSPKVTQGMISGDNGMQNDIRFWQISVPIQPGNSGGPLLNDQGELIGVIVATLGLKAVEITGTIPQNVNYAIKGNYLEPMLNVHKVTSARQSNAPANFQDMIAQAQKSSVLILVY